MSISAHIYTLKENISGRRLKNVFPFPVHNKFKPYTNLSTWAGRARRMCSGADIVRTLISPVHTASSSHLHSAVVSSWAESYWSNSEVIKTIISRINLMALKKKFTWQWHVYTYHITIVLMVRKEMNGWQTHTQMRFAGVLNVLLNSVVEMSLKCSFRLAVLVAYGFFNFHFTCYWIRLRFNDTFILYNDP